MKNILLVLAVIVLGSSCNTTKSLERKENLEAGNAAIYKDIALKYMELDKNSIAAHDFDSADYYNNRCKIALLRAIESVDKAVKYQKLIEEKLYKK